jgi:hypothetical protein
MALFVVLTLVAVAAQEPIVQPAHNRVLVATKPSGLPLSSALSHDGLLHDGLPSPSGPHGHLQFGLNLPAMNGSSGTGAFNPGVYNFSYTAEQLARMRTVGFDSIRLPVNTMTANDPIALDKMKQLVEAIGGTAVICMFGTGSLVTHGTGRVDSMKDTVAAWSNVHGVFGAFPNVWVNVGFLFDPRCTLKVKTVCLWVVWGYGESGLPATNATSSGWD